MALEPITVELAPTQNQGVQACWVVLGALCLGVTNTGHEGTTPIVPWYYNYNVVLIELVTLYPKIRVAVCGGGSGRRYQQTPEARIDHVRDTKSRRSGGQK